MRAPDLISDREIKEAHGIHTLDPRDPNAAGHHLWGDRSARSEPTPETPDPSLLAIALDSDDHVALLNLIARIERIKGTLPPDVKEMRKNLAS
jgi:hypothetical protein